MTSTRRLILIFIQFLSFPFFLFAQEEFNHPELEWRTIETDHFYVHYHLGTERTAKVVAKIGEDVFEPITALYNYKPDGKISFIIKDYDDYSNGGTYFFDNKIEIWASALDFDLRGTHNWLRDVVSHEFTHMIQVQASLKFTRKIPAIYLQWLGYESERRPDVLYGFPNIVVSYPISGFVIPVWFSEGTAQYNRKEFQYDLWDTHRDMLMRMYMLDDKMLTWNEMCVFGKTSLGNESSYNAGFSLVRYIAEHYGEDKLAEISRNLSSITALTIDGAIEKATGKTGKQIYDEWKEYLQRDYKSRTLSVKENLQAGEVIADVGFGNFYPTFSPDGKSIAYVSNKEADYFGLSSLYLYDVALKTEKKLQSGVRSSLSWSPDGKKIYYAKLSRSNPYKSNFFDIYVYDINSEEETRITNGLRAYSPSVSPNGKTIAFVAGVDGTVNLFSMDVSGRDIQQITHYTNGEQVYSPKWSPDGKTILFDYSIKDGRDIAMVSTDGKETNFLLATPDDERNGVFSSDGKKIIYSSDKTGIFNLYELDLQTKESKQITNVLGGVFMPTVNAASQVAFASYTSSGYKIAKLDGYKYLQQPGAYTQIAKNDTSSALLSGSFNWKSLRSYDDTKIPSFTDTKYKNIRTSLTIVPLLRVDNYNPKNKGIDIIKPGVYLFSNDMLDQYGFFAGAAMNLSGERDLFFNFDYRGKIPGLFQLGLAPTLSFEVYNITRKTDTNLELPLDTIGVDVSYNLLEFDLVLKQKLFTEALDFELRYAHSRYTASIGTFYLEESRLLVPATSQLYLIGNSISAELNYNAIAPSRTQEINPIGRKIQLRYSYEFNKFNPTSDYEVSDGLLVPKYQEPRFHSLQTSWREYTPLPGWKHTLTVQLRGGSILGPPVDDFFDFYIGGLAGMKGYPFYSLGGNEFFYSNLTYRFPVLEHIDLRFAQLYFDKLYAAVYGDVGTAWTGGGIKGQSFKRDAGVELRLESFSYYAYPTRIFFNATYGFDQFNRYVSNSATNVTYGKEWNFHFGILFGFDFD
jgi:Tol biopolymer transport system component